MKIIIKNTIGIGEILSADAKPMDIPAYLALANRTGSTGISVHADGDIGRIITEEREARQVAEELQRRVEEEAVTP
jgi:ArsR family metal-binding transcriptional regulator